MIKNIINNAQNFLLDFNIIENKTILIYQIIIK